jgi:glycerophosphoryl diester phosphodiesterase
MRYWLVLLTVILLGSCSKEYIEVSYEGTKLIAHRGNGSIASGLGQSEENTIKASIKGFALAAGIEIDVQRSNDNYVYLFHDVTVPPCGDHNIKSIPASTKSKIEAYFDCVDSDTKINTLNELLATHEDGYSSKDIFIDIKSIANIHTSLRMPTPQHYLNLMAQDIFDCIKYYPNQSSLNIESENGVLLNAFEKHYPKVNTWLACYGDFDKAIKRASKENYTGISIKDGDHITKTKVENAHKKGLKVCVWVVNKQERLETLQALKVDVVQTDNLDLEL